MEFFKRYFFGLFLILLLFSGCISKYIKGYRELEKKEAKEKKLVYWGAGDGEPYENFIRNSVSLEYGFEYKNIFGCMMSDEKNRIKDSHNKKIENLISKKYGKDWEIAYWNEIDTLNKIHQKTIIAIQSNAKLWDTLTPLIDTIKYNYATYFLHKTANQNHFIMKYCEADYYGKPLRDIYKLNVLVPEYQLRIIY